MFPRLGFVVGSSPAAGGTAGKPFSYRIKATNHPTSFGAAGLPAGLSVNPSTGIISGAPTSCPPTLKMNTKASFTVNT